MSEIIRALERDLAALVIRHSTISGAEFQQCALRVAAGYFEESDLDCYYSEASLLAEAVELELERLGTP